MDVIKNILINHWETIFKVVCLIIAFILLLVKKKPVKVVDTIREWIAEMVPFFVREAEDNLGAGLGASKRDYVIGKMVKLLQTNFSLSEDQANRYIDFISTMIEVVLNTPQKKGDKKNG